MAPGTRAPRQRCRRCSIASAASRRCVPQRSSSRLLSAAGGPWITSPPTGASRCRRCKAPAAAANAVRCALLDLDATTPLGWTTTMASAIDLRLAASRLLLLLGLGGLLTLAVATTGIYGAVAGDAVERRGELGLR